MSEQYYKKRNFLVAARISHGLAAGHLHRPEKHERTGSRTFEKERRRTGHNNTYIHEKKTKNVYIYAVKNKRTAIFIDHLHRTTPGALECDFGRNIIIIIYAISLPRVLLLYYYYNTLASRRLYYNTHIIDSVL